MEPVYTRGNVFWQNTDRFLIKGISYVPYTYETEGGQRNGTSIDPLSDEHLPDLERDIEVFKQLGLNTIQVMAIEPTKSHTNAMHVLQQHRIYVVAEVCETMQIPHINSENATAPFDPARYYTLTLMRRTLRVVDQLADFPNLLGFTVCGDRATNRDLTPLAAVSRAAIRDCKTFLRLRGGRIPPVGVNASHRQDLKLLMLQYYTAGLANERADFFAHECYSWVNKSSFRVSGWQNMVEAFQKYPVPMFLSEYGAVAGMRLWEEVLCLYSPDMTSVFSGGCAYTYFENGNSHGVVRINDTGRVMRKKEFERLQHHFGTVNRRETRELHGDEIRNYETWVGTFPPVDDKWQAGSDLPSLSASVDKMLDEIREERGRCWPVV